MNEKKYSAPEVPVSMPIQWFANADRKRTPRAGTVVGIENNISLSILLFPDRGVVRRMDGVRHIEDPFLQTCQHEHRVNKGAWDFVPGLRPQIETTGLTELIYGQDSKAELDEDAELLRLHGQGLSAVEIAEQLGDQWNHQKVNGRLRRYKDANKEIAEAIA